MLDGDPYAVVTGGRIVWVQDCYTTTAFYPYSEPVADRGLQLYPQLRQGRGGRLRRHRDSLRLRPGRSTHQGLPAHVPDPLPADVRHAGRPAPPRALPGGPVQHPGGQVPHLPHGGSAGLLQQGGRLERAHGAIPGPGAAGAQLLHHHALPRGQGGGVRPDAALHPARQGQHGGLARRALRRGPLRGDDALRVPPTDRPPTARARSRPGSTRTRASRSNSPSGARAAAASSAGTCS